jgi:maltooligosyltrehalose trehalohydrolase
LAYLQNHDQVGNRGQGERTSRLLNLGRLKVGAAIVLTSPFVPMLFQGEEWGASTPFFFFTDHAEPALGRAVREGRIRELAALGWNITKTPDPQQLDSFRRSKLNWAERSRTPHLRLLDWHRQLIRLRRAEPALNNSRLSEIAVRASEGERWLILERGPISVVCNLAARPRHISLRPGRHRLLLASGTRIKVQGTNVFLPADSVAILKMSHNR